MITIVPVRKEVDPNRQRVDMFIAGEEELLASLDEDSLTEYEFWAEMRARYDAGEEDDTIYLFPQDLDRIRHMRRFQAYNSASGNKMPRRWKGRSNRRCRVRFGNGKPFTRTKDVLCHQEEEDDYPKSTQERVDRRIASDQIRNWQGDVLPLPQQQQAASPNAVSACLVPVALSRGLHDRLKVRQLRLQSHC